MQVPDTIYLSDDGVTPNSGLPLLIYRGALDARVGDPLQHFAAHHWGNGWINGIYDFQHYHATAHEVLGIVDGTASVQFGGVAGPKLEVSAGDMVVIPAGIGHCRLRQTAQLRVAGAYPDGQSPDLRRATPEDRAIALRHLAEVDLPATDPLFGPDGPLVHIWRLADAKRSRPR